MCMAAPSLYICALRPSDASCFTAPQAVRTWSPFFFNYYSKGSATCG